MPSDVSLLSNPLEQGVTAKVMAELQRPNSPLDETVINFRLGTLQTEALAVPGEYLFINSYFAEKMYG